MVEKQKAFVIMPFHEEFNSIYEALIRDPLTEAGYEVTRADSLVDQENILRAIVRGISTAHLVIADLTTNNPNVFYELGLAHALRIPTVLLAQSMTDVPFDLRSYKIHIYDTHFTKIEKLKGFLTKIAHQHASGEISFANPVDDFLDGGTVEPIRESARDIVKTATTEIQEKELLDFIVDGEAGAKDMTAILAKLLKDNQVITERFKRHSGTIESLQKDPTAGSARKFHKVFLLAAADISNFAGKVEGQLPLLENAIERVNQNYSGFIQLVDPSQEQGRDALEQLRGQIENLRGVTKEAKVGINSFKEASSDLATKKLSQDLSRASRRQAEALGGVISNIERVEAFCVRALALIDDRLNQLVH